MKKMGLNRRTVLQGLGTSIALPMLEAMVPAKAFGQSAAGIPKRLMLVYRPMGNYQPNGALDTAAFAKVQTADIKPFVNLILRVHNQPGRDLDDMPPVNGIEIGQGEHGSCLNTLFAGRLPGYDAATIVNSKIWKQNVTFDQAIAMKYGLTSVLANVSTSSSIHPRWLNRYINTFSWKGQDSSLNPYTNPSEIFKLLFATSNQDTANQAEQLRRATQKSILDFVKTDISSVSSKIGASDKQILDQYLTSIRELEKRIDALSSSPSAGGAQCNANASLAPNITNQTQAEYPRRLSILQDLAVAAFQCDRAQVFNLMLAGDGDGVNFAAFLPTISGDGGWHGLSHYAEDSSNPAKFKLAVQWQYEQYKNLLLKMNAVKEADGSTLLYNSAVMMMSSISDGQTHNVENLNCVIGGNLGGKIKSGQVIEFAAGSKQPPATNVFLTLMRAFGMTESTFGNSTGTIPQMLA